MLDVAKPKESLLKEVYYDYREVAILATSTVRDYCLTFGVILYLNPPPEMSVALRKPNGPWTFYFRMAIAPNDLDSLVGKLKERGFACDYTTLPPLIAVGRITMGIFRA